MKADKDRNKQENDYIVSILTKKYEAELKQKDEEISRLKKNLELLKSGQKNLISKKDSISKALVVAVDKAKEIEDSSKRVYELKIQQLNALYSRWERLLEEMLQKYPNLTETEQVAHMTKSFKASLVEALSDELEAKSSSQEQDPMKTLLKKMSSPRKENEKPEKKVQIKRTPAKKEVEVKEKPSIIKPISNLEYGENEEFETLADKFLNEDDEQESFGLSKAIFSRKIEGDPYAFPDVNESGFNLEEAVNPKDDLEQIMKSFDFYEGE